MDHKNEIIPLDSLLLDIENARHGDLGRPECRAEVDGHWQGPRKSNEPCSVDRLERFQPYRTPDSDTRGGGKPAPALHRRRG